MTIRLLLGVSIALAATATVAQNTHPGSALSAQQVVIDPATGQMRAPEHDEMTTTAPAPAANARGVAPAVSAFDSHPAVQQLRALPPARAKFGAAAKRLDPSKLSFSVARIGADGKLEQVCVTGEDAATHAMHQGHTHAATPAARGGETQ